MIVDIASVICKMFTNRMDTIICEKCGKKARDYCHITHYCHTCCIQESDTQ